MFKYIFYHVSIPRRPTKTTRPSAGGFSFGNHRTGIEPINKVPRTKMESVGGVWVLGYVKIIPIMTFGGDQMRFCSTWSLERSQEFHVRKVAAPARLLFKSSEIR